MFPVLCQIIIDSILYIRKNVCERLERSSDTPTDFIKISGLFKIDNKSSTHVY